MRRVTSVCMGGAGPGVGEKGHICMYGWCGGPGVGEKGHIWSQG